MCRETKQEAFHFHLPLCMELPVPARLKAGDDAACQGKAGALISRWGIVLYQHCTVDI